MVVAGILSDTHMSCIDNRFSKHCQMAFAQVPIIFHAGDLTEGSILEVFGRKRVFAVHGNSCSPATRRQFPEMLQVEVAGKKIGLTHGSGRRDTVEDRVYALFPDADCVIYGHTHTPRVSHCGDTLLVNPGSFQGTGPYGAPGTYALLHLVEGQLQATLHYLSQTP